MKSPDMWFAFSSDGELAETDRSEPSDLAELDSAVARIEEDLHSTFIDMEERTSQYEASSTKTHALLSLKSHINDVMQQQRIVNFGFGVKHFEQEGADAVLFGNVPAWITFERICGYRYRMVRTIVDPADEFELEFEGVTFYGTPGASGWADKVGDVAVHYMSAHWAVFSKIYPFFEQSDARTAHEDVLLLGSTKHVMLTPVCAWRIGEGGLGTPSTPLTCLSGEGGLFTSRSSQLTVGKAPSEAIHRLYLGWGHEESDFAPEMEQFSFDLPALIQASKHEAVGMSALRFMGSMAARLVNGGQKKVQEHWMRYPSQPLEPSYYAQLLATAASMDEEEQRARAMMEPRATPREGQERRGGRGGADLEQGGGDDLRA